MARRKTRRVYRTRTKTRYRTRVVRRTRYVASRMRHYSRHGWRKWLTPMVAVGTGIQQMTEADVKYAIDNGYWNTLDMVGKIKFIAGKMIGRTTGISVFPESGETSLNINPAGVLNKWTGLGIAFLIARKVPMLPYKSELGAVGKGMLEGGIIGGLFDPSPQQVANGRATVNLRNSQPSIYGA